MEKVKCSVTKQGDTFVRGVEEGVKIGKEQEQKRIIELSKKIKIRCTISYPSMLNHYYVSQRDFEEFIKQIQSQDTGDGQGFGSVETIGDVSEGTPLCRENKSEMGSEWSLSPDTLTWEEVIKKLEEVEK